MPDDYPDLRATLQDALRRSAGPATIWCEPSEGFGTKIDQRPGVVFGGSWSPAFLREESTTHGHTKPGHIPWCVRLSSPRLALLPSATAPLSQWVTLMEQVSQSGESLLIVSDQLDRMLLRTLLINWERGTLAAAAVRTAAGVVTDEGLGDAAEGPAPPQNSQALTLAHEVWIRRSSSVVFLDPDDASQNVLSPITVITVGGDHYDDQQSRLRFLMNAIEQLHTGG